MAPAFHAPLDIRQLGRRRWMTLAPLVYRSDLLVEPVTIPSEFITDLASVPRLPFAYLLAGDRAHGPAVVHDWLYQHPDWEDRALADAMLLEAMTVEQLDLGFEAESLVMRRIIWAGVRAGGWLAWREHGKRQAALNPIWTRTGWPGTNGV